MNSSERISLINKANSDILNIKDVFGEARVGSLEGLVRHITNCYRRRY